jgi:hypothetical protein
LLARAGNHGYDCAIARRGAELAMRNFPEQRQYIHGNHADANSGRLFETVNPATGEAICTVQATR